jgi:hypothetical protein
VGAARHLIALDVVAGALCCLFTVGLVREIGTRRSLPPPAVWRVSPGIAAPAAGGRESPESPPGAYAAITSRNLFSPTRSEAPPGPALAGGPKPFLWGIVVNGAKSRAYLEDPVAKRVFGFGVGDAVSGGHLKSIDQDRVVIDRPDGLLEVMLQDPAKPRAATPAAVTAPLGMHRVPATGQTAGTPAISTAPTPRPAPSRFIAPGAPPR